MVFFSGFFVQKTSGFFGFGVCCGLRVFRFLAYGFRFSSKIIAVFRFYYPLCGLYSVFGFG